MPVLSNAEILAALPVEARRKIDSAFEALSQSLPTDQERLILYRVAHTLKLNPTDTHFSILAAMHYYLQLYGIIPDKIIKAGGEVIAAGREVDLIIRTATKETLSEHKETLSAQSDLIAQQTRKDLIGMLGQATARMTDDMAAHGRQQSLVRAVGGIALLSSFLYVTAYLQGGGGLGMAMLAGTALLVGMSAGGMMCRAFFPREVYIEAESKTASDRLWSDAEFRQAAAKTNLSDRTLKACHEVLVLGTLPQAAATKVKTEQAQVSRGLKVLRENR